MPSTTTGNTILLRGDKSTTKIQIAALRRKASPIFQLLFMQLLQAAVGGDGEIIAGLGLLKLLKMKALMKGNAAKYFQKKEKAVEDPEVVMNALEAKALSKIIGIAEYEIPKFAHFFEQIAKLKLPYGYSRYMNPDKTKLIYLNEKTNEESELHPTLDLIKIAFYEMITDSKAVYGFEVKSRKLLPLVEEKLMRQCMGLSSKRRDAEKNNIQRDEQGNIVISKMARVAPDMRSLISSRSYMLKALVEKIYTRKELWGRGKRANTYASILLNYRSSRGQNPEDDEEQVSEESLQRYQQLFEQNCSFYMKTYGDVLFIPEELKNTKAYFRSTPESVLRNLNILNINKDELEMYWLARFMECLPLPLGWSIKLGESFDQYVEDESKMVFDLHPSYIYVVQQMNKFKILFAEMDLVEQNYYTNMREMVFYDYFERPYDVDLFGLMQKDQQGPITKKKAVKKSLQLGTNDWMALEAMHCVNISEAEYPLIERFLKYWGSLNYREEIFLPAISPFGEVAWSSAINQKAVQFCPHSATLNVIFQQSLIDLPLITQTYLKNSSEPDEQQKKRADQLLLNIFPTQREKFLQHYLRWDPKPLSQPYELPAECSEPDFYNQIFTCAFDLEQTLQLDQAEGIPLWLEKVHAKKKVDMDCAVLDWNPDAVIEMRDRFGEYAIEMVREHEPDREDELVKALSLVETAKALKQLMKQVNDIDAREERKRLANLGMAEEEKQDSFGSSLSQIDMEDKLSDGLSDGESLEFQDQINDDEEESEPDQDEKSSAGSIALVVPSDHAGSVIEQSEEEANREPEKYYSVTYERDPKVEQMSSQELDSSLKGKIRQHTLKHKFSQSNIRKKTEAINLNAISTEAKRNLMVSNLHSEKGPYRTNPAIFQNNPRGTQTPMGLPDISEGFLPFRSEASEYDNSRVHSEIERWKEVNLNRQESEESELPDHKRSIDDTKETIQLQPILRMKPSIEEDGRLRHVSNIANLSAYARSFQMRDKNEVIVSLKKVQNPQTSKKIKKDVQSELQKKLTVYESPKETGLHKSSSVMSISNKSISPSKFESKFNRVCLGSTASSLLSSEALTRRGELVVLEARKSLISKGRGLETMLSKNY